MKRLAIKSMKLLLIAALLAGFSLQGARLYTEEFHETYSVSEEMDLNLYNVSGSINIEKWDKNEVQVKATKSTNWGKAELKKVTIDVTTDGEISIKTKYPEENVRVGVSYKIKVPASIRVRDVRTSNGTIELNGTSGPSNLESSNGSIVVRNASGDMKINTSNGKIEVEKLKGTVEASTSNGRIEIRETDVIKSVETSNGSIEVEISKLHEDRTEIETNHGSILVKISPDIDASIEIETSLGSVELRDLDLKISERERNYISGKLGEGGEEISIETSLGSIVLERL